MHVDVYEGYSGEGVTRGTQLLLHIHDAHVEVFLSLSDGSGDHNTISDTTSFAHLPNSSTPAPTK